jgi:uncharacterized membrane protein
MRFASIDVLRTFAIFVMVLVHFGENLSGYVSPLTGLGAPLFAFLSAVSYYLWVQGQIAQGKSQEEISKVSVRRGLFVIGIGFLFNVFVWLPEDTFNWDVLTFVGTALILLDGFRRVPLPITTLAAAMGLLISPILRGQADYAAYWQNGYFECDFTLSDLLIGFLCTGYFPVFPWIAFSLCGYVAAAKLFGPVDAEESRVSPWSLVWLGAGLIAFSLLAIRLRSYLPDPIGKNYLGGWTMFPPTIEYVLGTLGMTLAMLGLAHRWIDRNPQALRWKGWFDIARTFSRYSLTVYILHHVVHLWPLWIYGLSCGFEPTHFWMKALPITTSIVLALVFLGCTYGILSRLRPDRNYGLEAWMRWLCD